MARVAALAPAGLGGFSDSGLPLAAKRYLLAARRQDLVDSASGCQPPELGGGRCLVAVRRGPNWLADDASFTVLTGYNKVMRQKTLYALFTLSSLLGVAGCSQQTLNSARQDTQRNIETAKPQLAKLSLGGRVTAALAAADIHGVRVDADTNSVSLHGTVHSADQKTRAGHIARDTLGPKTRVVNQIKVGGG